MNELRVLQISDCHLGASEDARYRGLPALDNLNRLLALASIFDPQLIIVTGDISEDSSHASYQLFANSLAGQAARIVCLPGNHDLPAVMRETLEPAWLVSELGWSEAGWRFHLLDSTIADQAHGGLDAARLDTLAQALDAQEEPMALIFLHHQPLAVGSAWIDKYPLLQEQTFRRLIAAQPKVRAVGWGHIHHAWRRRIDNRLWLGCPSTVSNSRAFVDDFEYDSAGPAARWFRLFSDRRMATGILRAGV